MKRMPFPFEFESQEEGAVQEFHTSDYNSGKDSLLSAEDCWNKGKYCFVGSSEPSSVLDRSLASSSTLSSSLGSGGGGGGGGGGASSSDTARVAAVSGNPASRWKQDNTTATSSNAGGGESESELFKPVPPCIGFGAGRDSAAVTAEKCGMDEWDLSGSVAASPDEEPLLRWIMGDVDGPSMASLNKVLQASGPAEYGFNAGYPAMDQGFGIHPGSSGDGFIPAITPSISMPGSGFPVSRPPNPPESFKYPENTQVPIFPSGFDPDLLMNLQQTQQTQNHSVLLPLPYARHEPSHHVPPPAKRQNRGFQEPGGSLFQGSLFAIAPPQPHQMQFPPNNLSGEETGQSQSNHQQQAIIDELFTASELVQSGRPNLAQAILARLNHYLSPMGNPFLRAAFYCKESLESILQSSSSSSSPVPPFSVIYKLGAYKSFSEISPITYFTNFTCNQALLEALEGFDRIRIVDFDIGCGGHWASLMHELSVRSAGVATLKITVLASPAKDDHEQLRLSGETLIESASEFNIAFEFEIVTIDSLNDLVDGVLEDDSGEAIAVNLPVSCFTAHQLSHASVLGFVKKLSPKIVVSIDRPCDRTDLQFPHQVISVVQYFSNLLESLDAVNVNLDALQKIETFFVQPAMEKIVVGRSSWPEKTQNLKTAFLSSGFLPVTFSNLNESQAECVVKRTPVRGFHVEKRQSSLVLFWQRKELISVSAWRC
ncbi:unnamed protein product [Cuscuta europaea]|uniref:Scarecrow-like protein 6 n=1 Tax=Cuscuta europaea TaxID=41803 RepID=A0A9P0ZDZ1_CUSEU|nr:unnamed protein product [Cuscuta europaea]